MKPLKRNININGQTRRSLLVTLLCVLMLALPLLSACETSTEPPVYDSRLNFLTTSGVSIFRIVYPQEETSDVVLTAAQELQAAMQEVLGVEVAMTDDKGAANATDQFQPYEILIGQTARSATQKVLPELTGEDYVVCVDGHKIVIVGATNRATYAGVRHFIQSVIRKGEMEDGKPVVKIETDYEYKGTYESPKQPAAAGDIKLPVAPYRPVVLYTVHEPESLGDQVTLATLQGLSTLYASEQVFVLRDGNESVLTSLMEQGVAVTYRNDAGDVWSLSTLMAYYANRVSGYILCSSEVGGESMEVAINLSHYLNALVVTPDNEEVAKEAGLTLLLDVTDKDDAWLRTTPYFAKLVASVAIEPDIEQSVAFVDYVVMAGCYYHDYHSGDEYMHVQAFKHLSQGAYLLTLPTDDVHHTISFESIGVNVLTPDAIYYQNLSILMAANAKQMEKELITEK